MLDSRVIHAMAYLRCLKPADTYMNEFAAPEEIAIVMAEERKEARDAIRSAHKLAMNKSLIDEFMPDLADQFPITRIKAPPSFASKDEEILLQIADACAWTFQRHIRGGDQSERFIHALFGEFAHPTDLSHMRTEAARYYGFVWREPAQAS
jgi:hypothetical protein